METKVIVRFDALEVVAKMIEILTEQHQAAVKASAEEDDQFDDWPSIDGTVEPKADPTLSVYRYRLAQALLNANGIEIGLCAMKTEIEEDGCITVQYWG